MKLVKIINAHDVEYIVNVTNISCIFHNGAYVVISTCCGRVIATKFTDVDHAVDYIQRAPSHSFIGGL